MEITCLLRGSEMEHFPLSCLFFFPLSFFLELFLLCCFDQQQYTLSCYLLTAVERLFVLFILTVCLSTELYLLICGALKKNQQDSG